MKANDFEIESGIESDSSADPQTTTTNTTNTTSDSNNKKAKLDNTNLNSSKNEVINAINDLNSNITTQDNNSTIIKLSNGNELATTPTIVTKKSEDNIKHNIYNDDEDDSYTNNNHKGMYFL